MRTTRQIPQDEWERYFERLTSLHLRPPAQHLVTIEQLSLDVGDQHEVDGAPLVGIAWNPGDNMLEVVVAAEDDDFAFSPEEIWVVEEDDGFVSTLEVIRRDGAREIVQILRMPSTVAEIETGP